MFLLSAAAELMSISDLGIACGVFLLFLALSSIIWVFYVGASTMVQSKMIQIFLKND